MTYRVSEIGNPCCHVRKGQSRVVAILSFAMLSLLSRELFESAFLPSTKEVVVFYSVCWWDVVSVLSLSLEKNLYMD